MTAPAPSVPVGGLSPDTAILGIETSCDETAAAVVLGGHVVRSSVVSSQVDIHARYGGVVPEIASRAHVDLLAPVIAEALVEAGVEGGDLAGHRVGVQVPGRQAGGSVGGRQRLMRAPGVAWYRARSFA